MSQFIATVIANEQIMPATHVLALQCGLVARQALPGQFLHIRCSEGSAPLLRRPMIRFFACEDDISHEAPDAPLPAAVASGAEPLWIVGAIAGG